MSDYYAELGVTKSATEPEIRAAYRKLAQQLHPDRNQNNPSAEARFKKVNEAFHVLTDQKKRKLYDQFGEVGLREGFDPNAARGFGGFGRSGGLDDIFGGHGGAGIGDMLGDLFGGGRGRRSARKNPDTESEIAVEFVSAVRGAELELALQQGQAVKVRIPKGARDGDKLRVRGAGSRGHPGLPPGDLLLTLRVKGHPYFERDGLDLTVELPISAREAYHGAKVEVPTTDKPVTLTVPPHTQSGQLVRLREKGVTRGSKTGDLYVRFMIHLPTAESPEIEQAIQALDGPVAAEARGKVAF